MGIENQWNILYGYGDLNVAALIFVLVVLGLNHDQTSNAEYYALWVRETENLF